MPYRMPAENIKNLHTNNQTMFKALQSPCADCNIIWHPLVMSFDHIDRGRKFKNVPELRTYAPEVFNAEIAKCEVVCLNCHAFREFMRDMGIMEISEAKKNTHRYYQRLIPYTAGGAILRKDAFNFVRISAR